MSETFRLKQSERTELEALGFVTRRDVFDAAEVGAICDASEALVERVLAEKRRTKHTVGSYMFEIQRQLETIVKWEPDNPDLVQGLEPFAHLSEELNRWGLEAWTRGCSILVKTLWAKTTSYSSPRS